jgi:hypothetical protein
MGGKCRHAHGAEELRQFAPTICEELQSSSSCCEEAEKDLMMKLLEKLSEKQPIELSLMTSLPTTAAGTPAPGSPRLSMMMTNGFL